jgi:hypothetical protein
MTFSDLRGMRMRLINRLVFPFIYNSYRPRDDSLVIGNPYFYLGPLRPSLFNLQIVSKITVCTG